MAKFSAERERLGEMIGLVCDNGQQKGCDSASGHEDEELGPVTRLVQIKNRKFRDFSNGC